MMYSNIEDKFDVHLNHFESVYGDIPSFFKYVKETWLTLYKERFVPAWTNRVTHLGNTTTNRVESAQWRLKNMLTTSRDDLCASWNAVNTMLKLKLGSIRASFQKSIVYIEHRYNTPFYSKLHSFVSRQCIQLIRKKLEKVKFVGTSKERCGCYIRTTDGLPYACQLAGYQILGIPIPLETIHVFWTKLQISEHEKKVCDLAYPFTTSMCPPPMKYKPKRGIKKSRKGEDVHRDPSQGEYADASQGSQTTKRSCTKPSGSQSSTMPIGKQPSTNFAKCKYLYSFVLSFIHISMTFLMLNRMEIVVSVGKEKWMSIPDMDYHVASRYSDVKLRPDCPLPPVTDRWRKNHSNNTKA
ncbi:uncharacterized protein LOC131657679 [Vicia villosa]|uniref:uncharacterized protein LOC131657679 n=1 Tax=Vicia villosa TaxID=3911 RepID=UPI00273C76BB|nr:uncharacterized protein LOC131657679 [Vicia villosa]